MLELYFWPILITLVIVIVGLSFLAGRLWRQISDHKRIQTKQIQEKMAKEVERKEFVEESLRIITKSMLEGQCDLSEGCIRVRMLIERTDNIDAKNEEFKVFFDMYEEIKHFKTHEARKELSKQELFNEDKERLKIEERYRDLLLEASRRLLRVVELLRV